MTAAEDCPIGWYVEAQLGWHDHSRCQTVLDLWAEHAPVHVVSGPRQRGKSPHIIPPENGSTLQRYDGYPIQSGSGEVQS